MTFYETHNGIKNNQEIILVSDKTDKNNYIFQLTTIIKKSKLLLMLKQPVLDMKVSILSYLLVNCKMKNS